MKTVNSLKKVIAFVILVGIVFSIFPQRTYSAETTHEVKISKINRAEEELSGAMLRISSVGGSFYEEWISDNSPSAFNLTSGRYSIEEIQPPEGYKKIAGELL